MNKLFLVLLAVCLVNAHAFVRREAPTTEENYLEDFKNTLEGISAQIQEAAKKNLNPDQIKNQVNKFSEEIKILIDSVKTGGEASKQ